MQAPSNYLLCSFNALTLTAPSDIFERCIVCTSELLSDDSDTAVTLNSFCEFNGAYNGGCTAQRMQTDFNASFGLAAEYAEVAGSTQTTYTQSHYASSTAFNAAYYCEIKWGKTFLNNDSPKSIKGLLKPQLLSSLEGIRSLADAENFVNAWGTHLITGVNLGGSLFIAIQANTTTVKDCTDVSASVGAAYSSAATSIEATAAAAQQVSSTSTAAGISQSIAIFGGNPSLAAQVKASDRHSFSVWANSCDARTIQSLNTSMPFAALLEPGSTSRNMLERYLQLSLLVKSLMNPRACSNYTELGPGMTQAQVQAPKDGYKIISGGAELTQYSSCLLTGTFPLVDPTDGVSIEAWRATCHQAHGAVDGYLTAHALAVYDPFNLLQVKASSNCDQASKSISYSEVTASTLGSVMVGGGGSNENDSTSAPRYLLRTCPNADMTWTTCVHDYLDASTSSTAWSFAVGITPPPELILTTKIISARAGEAHQGDTTAECAPGRVLGGGAACETGTHNILWATYPRSLTAWRERNTDAYGLKEPCFADALAITWDQVTLATQAP